ncbi:CRISPR-associated protein Csx3 [Candidatus Methylacidiphilum fumarolicum]|uniref:CRISPR-associated protein Csx3 n=2 Tax=Candidatus Methylacidiphilum fumarolicum TaxID=591154 RepID=I0JXU5_METFB|nr:CRISPR-associated ring nuclease Crn3/Csx3 [Candidatus Methylacidiphilum fumarolicum]MBW6414226.1 CRISPR-associated protein Csx3 [Candidatus Methylacidiphilum fumarolicum]TFE69940.1 CRISPR-associated protein Csx3 [Candidatus Methylacidiphilum fumarolicum]TFE73744.1 CRISPR-associated protein Csx3 [Candidatus Methylacidiphilum fumarolicum]TFE75650.1 CRISPR-associated protein Csx3 [Candidatus Methylacidiphilum fumarolicum]TFE76813.1 CRISPR-associated protein Csx3 [Candidatus Methylacidiphilum f
MNNLDLRVIDTPKFQILNINIAGNGTVEPSVLKNLELPKLDYTKGVVLHGRGPIWLYGHLVHQCHPARWVGVFDPRIGGVVVERHHKEAPEVGETIPANEIQKYLEHNQEQAKDSSRHQAHMAP